MWKQSALSPVCTAGALPAHTGSHSASGTYGDDSRCQTTEAADGMRGFRRALQPISVHAYIYRSERRISRAFFRPVARGRAFLSGREFGKRPLAVPLDLDPFHLEEDREIPVRGLEQNRIFCTASSVAVVWLAAHSAAIPVVADCRPHPSPAAISRQKRLALGGFPAATNYFPRAELAQGVQNLGSNL